MASRDYGGSAGPLRVGEIVHTPRWSEIIRDYPRLTEVQVRRVRGYWVGRVPKVYRYVGFSGGLAWLQDFYSGDVTAVATDGTTHRIRNR